MGLTAWLALVYLLLIALAVFAFARKKQGLGFSVLAAIIASVIVPSHL